MCSPALDIFPSLYSPRLWFPLVLSPLHRLCVFIGFLFDVSVEFFFDVYIRVSFDIVPFHVGQHQLVPAFYVRQLLGFKIVPICALPDPAWSVLSGLVGRWEYWLLLTPVSVFVSNDLRIIWSWIEVPLGIGFFCWFQDMSCVRRRLVGR